MSKLCYEASIRIEFEPSWEIECAEDMVNAIDVMSGSIEQLVLENDPTVQSIEISEYTDMREED